MRIPGGRFPVALATGEWAVVMDDRIESRIGVIPFPKTAEGEPFAILYTVAWAAAGVFKLSGQAQREPHHVDRGAWEWRSDTRAWEHKSLHAPGTNPLIYTADGTLVIADPVHNGSQGWRYRAESGELVTGDDTYNAERWAHAGRLPALAGALGEFTCLGGLFFGQGETGLDVVFPTGTRRRLEDGGIYNIRVDYRDGTWAVAFENRTRGDVFVDWFDAQRLLDLPITAIDVSPGPVDPVDPSPKPEPTPVPEYPVPVALQQDYTALVRGVRDALFPDKVGQPLNDPAKAMRLTKHVAWRLRDHGVGLVKAKPGSENNVDGYTSDIVAISNGVHWDIQIDGHTGAAYAQWAMEPNPANYPAIAARWVPAVDPGDIAEQEPDEEPQKPPVDESLAKRVEHLETQVSFLRKQNDELLMIAMQLNTDLGVVTAKVVELEHRPAAKLPKLKVVASPDGESVSTGRAYGHSHELRLKVIEGE